ncbi:MAG: hypothetical protein CM1200mP39_24660 [Dehalococcoidia bacterium]|nr:MAG: hypothetical protein CM1200mP39_24660 [Dehalococcoidia bacterium]
MSLEGWCHDVSPWDGPGAGQQGIPSIWSPGYILTDLNRENFADEEFKRKKISLIPMERLGIPDDVAGQFFILLG